MWWLNIVRNEILRKSNSEVEKIVNVILVYYFLCDSGQIKKLPYKLTHGDEGIMLPI